METEDRSEATRAELLQEVRRLEQLVAAYEKINAYSERELIKANRMILAYEEAQDLSQSEILQLQQQMQSGLHTPVPHAASETSLKERIQAAIAGGLVEQADHIRNAAARNLGRRAADHKPPPPGGVLPRLEEIRATAGAAFYTEFFRLMVHLDFSEREARVYWDDIVEHTQFLSRALGRAIPLRVAMLDYFLQRSPVLHNPRLIEMHTFDEVVRTSLQDELTGLYNRRYLDRCLLQEFRRAERQKLPVAVLVLDIDNFKSYNDAFGHPAGDEVMRIVGALLMATFREEDQPCRYGGEEFVVVLPETTADQALRVAARFTRAMRSTDFPLRAVTMSGGVADYPASGNDPGAVFLAADQALYRAKLAGKNRILRAKNDGEPQLTRDRETPAP